MSSTSIRKKDHLDICLNENPSYKIKTTGFEKYEFVHNALPELNLEDISLTTKFFGKKISYPFMVSCMTGGTVEAESINAQLAELASEFNIPVGVGSQRQLLEDGSNSTSYSIIRQKAKNVPVLGNIGGQQLLNLSSLKIIQKLIDVIEADFMVIHLNPLQELLQKEGDYAFKGILKRIKELAKILSIPVIVKEVGFGINKDVARRLLKVGIGGIDVAGSGGTSWAAVELLRNKSNKSLFWEWGLPTSYCIRMVAELKSKYDFYLIGSGGINNGFDIAKAIALGADITASAGSVLKMISTGGVKGAAEQLSDWFNDLRKILLLTGNKSINKLNKKSLIRIEEL